MNRLSPAKRKAVVASLVEGNSIRATCRMTGVAKATVMKLLLDLASTSGRAISAPRPTSCPTSLADCGTVSS